MLGSMDRGDFPNATSGHGDPELCGLAGLQAYCFDCRHVGQAAEFKVIGGDFGAKQCPKCGSLNVAIEGTPRPDLNICEVSVSSAEITDDQQRELVSLLKRLGIKVGKGKLADVRKNGDQVIVSVPRVIFLAVITALTELGVSEEAICAVRCESC